MSLSWADLMPTPEEFAVLAEAVREVNAESQPDSGYDSYDGDADLSGYDDDDEYGAQLARIGATIDLAGEREQVRIQEDLQDSLARRPAFEDKLSRAFDRLARGTYSPAGMYAQGRDPLGQYATHGCGPLDEFGRCGSRYHAGECFETFRGEAATGSTEAIESWRSTLLDNSRAVTTVGLAREQLAGDDDDRPYDLATLDAMRGILGITARS